MNSMRSLCSMAICLCIQLSVCSQWSTVFVSPSLWGKKLQFEPRPCLRQLQPNIAVPALQQLSVCLILRRNYTSDWTGFAYKAPGDSHIELGLGGKGSQLVAWLFGEEYPLEKKLELYEWYTVCLTWSRQAQRLRLYVNGANLLEASVNSSRPQHLTPRGTLTLGVSHNVDASGKLKPESGSSLLGEIGLFRMWAREWSAEELGRKSCADGDVVSWDLRQWKFNCPLEPDSTLRCEWSIYKIKMWTFIEYSPKPETCSISLEETTRHWLENIFPQTISVRHIFVSSLSEVCPAFSNASALHIQRTQGSTSNSTCDKCFSCEVYVNVDPAADVAFVQHYITKTLMTSRTNSLNLIVDPKSLSILPVESFPVATAPPPTVSSSITFSGNPNMSTTRDPLDVNETAVGPDTLLFRVNLTMTMTGNPSQPKDVIEKWLNEKLKVNGTTMVVLNLKIKEGDGRNTEEYNGAVIPLGPYKEYECNFHIQEYGLGNITEIMILIREALTSKYENGAIVIQAADVMIKHIVPGNCLEEPTSTIYGKYVWPETFPQLTQEMRCNEPVTERAYRLCKLDIETDATSWAEPVMSKCKPLMTISDLDKLNVTIGNAGEIVDMIEELVDVQLSNSAELSAAELDTVVKKLDDVMDVSIITPDLGSSVINIVADILLSKTDVAPVANTVLNLAERMGDNMDFQGESLSLTAPSLALTMVNVEPDKFRGLTFGVASVSLALTPQTFVNQSFTNVPLPNTAVTISLPSSIHNFFPSGDRKNTRVHFQFYGNENLFKESQITKSTKSNWILNSYIVSASINNSHVFNLKENSVVVTFSHKKVAGTNDKVECVFWDFQKNGGQGGWNNSGCAILRTSSYQTSCLCDHLTHFAVLLDVVRAPVGEVDSQILTVISYIGCGISSIFLGVTLITYLAFVKLRQDYPSKILINLSVALLGLNMLFLLDSWLSSFSNYSMCIVTAATLHYFLLASFTWMGLEAVHMYFALVKVFNTYVHAYIFKFCAVGWGIPLVIVSLVLAIDKDAYGSIVPKDTAVMLESSDAFCWLRKDICFYVTVVAIVVLILLCNITVFIVVLIQIKHMTTTKSTGSTRSSVLNELRAVASLTVLLGLTWSMGFFAFGPARVVMLYLFSILNSFQGFFIFVFHCLMKENVRKRWRSHLCWGRFRQNEHSDMSHSVIVGGQGKKNQPVNFDSVASNNTSSIRKSSASSTESRGHQHHGSEQAST
ncbi:hypothetical protein LDENG_00278750 [Lucifuga dentata]|nr:hypothetical protein LDENG_00278750 [Lucifuga dentata]